MKKPYTLLNKADPYLWILPSIILMCIFIIPIGFVFRMSMSQVTYLYKLAFYNSKQGEAAAVSVIGFLILLVCASIYMVSTLKKGDE